MVGKTRVGKSYFSLATMKSRSSPGERVATSGVPRSDYWPAKRPPEPPPDAVPVSETDRKRYSPFD